MDEKSVVTAYRRLSRQYDRFFGPVFEQGREVAVRKMECRAGDRVLEVGVGTGLSLDHYADDVEVVGIDVSPEMLEYAKARVNGNADRISLALMDAQALEYADNSFDKVVAMYVVSVAPDPKKVVEEMKRVCKPGGDLFIVNHFSQGKGAMASLERMVSPLSKLVGFRPSFPLDDFLEMADLDVVETRPVNAFGYWTFIHARNKAG
ncbi:phosphatidylethanolamine N-methyltransferase [Salinisphaera shabanensis T35B1]|jgi:phosphatidylethanolamine/phosphatidyl-N-methylethanolamine N-methyltransferase|uniref:Phosphatidylethanolamine N-methyltransferase protein n=1 Tax=Salinisphaera shabanensis E1L3A TaxID=1033802 RepID=U2EQ42_9GAMM|nr:class I SAM-dependent methyltransferase [Salinisphaera shabanensis]ERJ20182.1 phosphatidylethanolamine N-methyltransferase protein [Salinisphaera shabanensis E1L3A]|tara:strand:- start:105 stop:722 length:618 start_codon:yes stop_codon:yes gene_type:complete